MLSQSSQLHLDAAIRGPTHMGFDLDQLIEPADNHELGPSIVEQSKQLIRLLRRGS